MTDTLQSRASEAAADLHDAVATRPLPTETFAPHRPQRHQRRLTLLVALTVAVVLITGVVAIVGHNRNGTSPADHVEVPPGYRAVIPTGAGFGVAIPATWVDGPHPTGLNVPFDVLAMHDPVSGAKLTVLAQDVGSTTVKVEADLVAANLERSGVNVPEVPDDSAGAPGYHMTWTYTGENDAYIIKGS